MKKCIFRTLEQAGANICSMGYQNSKCKIDLSLFGCAEKYTEQITHCALVTICKLQKPGKAQTHFSGHWSPVWLPKSGGALSRSWFAGQSVNFVQHMTWFGQITPSECQMSPNVVALLWSRTSPRLQKQEYKENVCFVSWLLDYRENRARSLAVSDYSMWRPMMVWELKMS